MAIFFAHCSLVMFWRIAGLSSIWKLEVLGFHNVELDKRTLKSKRSFYYTLMFLAVH